MTNTAAPKTLDAFLARKRDIDRLLERLAALSADHFGVAPDDIDRGHVGDLEHCAAGLREISDRVFGEGEYAG